MACVCSHDKGEQKHRVPDTYYINNDYTNVTKVD